MFSIHYLMNKLCSVYSAHLIDLLSVQHAFLLYSHYINGQVWWSFLVPSHLWLEYCRPWMCAALELNLVWPKLLQFLVFVLPVLTEYWKVFLSFSCMYASFYASLGIYIYWSCFIFLDLTPKQWPCRVPKTFQLGSGIFTTWRTKWRMWMYSFISQTFYTFWCVWIYYVSDEVVIIPNYSILRRGADEPGHTSIAVYVHNSIRYFTHTRYDLESAYVECILLQVKTGRGPPFFVAFIYRSLSSTLVWFDEFVVMMDRVQNSKHHNEILLLGDFNIDMFKPNPAWVSTLSLFNLHQCVQSPTRVTSTTSTRIDHIYVSSPDRLIRTHVPITSMSDHYPVCCILSCQIPKAKAGNTPL